MFVGYSETSKAYRIYIPSQRLIELSRDVIFEEDIAFRKSKGSLEIEDQDPPDNMEEDHAPEIQRETSKEIDSEDQIAPLDEPSNANRKRPLWARKMIQEAKNYTAPKGTFRESKRPHKFSSYVALMSEIINSEPSCVKEALNHQVWKDAMSKEYQSIVKNDVWDIVPRPKEKSVVSSKWLFKIKHVADGSIEKHKARFVARGFSRKEGIDYEETFAPVARYTSVKAVCNVPF